ncbi:ATP-binding protein [Microvirga sesbaniae]|uniref:ATP-binding protein n=1 Tax=Microvirga sesbaniae TaxID=681392 RepID=UPI0021C759B4|nr:AAA family ATPase [Microvirga sp. HBU67692]
MTRSSNYSDPIDPRHASNAGEEAAGERRNITSLFYDIVNSTALLNLVDPEDFHQALLVVHKQIQSSIEEQGGYLGQVQGDGGLAFFGYPAPTEDAAYCAVTAALIALRRCQDSKTVIRGQYIGVRFGIATGVVLLNPANTENSTDRQFVGLALNLASRIQSEVEANSIAVAESTYQLTKSAFEYELIGMKILKGFASPQRLWRPLRHREVIDRFSTYRSQATPFVSRTDEMQECRRLWRQATHGVGQAIIIVGEPGVGKSRLLAELSRDLEPHLSIVRLYQCQPRGNSRPLHPFIDRLQREVRNRTNRSSSVAGRDLEGYFDTISPGHKRESVETIEFLLNHPLGERPSSEKCLDPQPDPDFAARAVDAILDLLSAACKVRPQVIAIEDFQWADTLTRYVVDDLIGKLKKLPLLLIITSRDEADLSRFAAEHVQKVALAPLDRASVKEMVLRLGVPVGSEPLISLIFQRSDGIPLFVEEFVRLLQDQLGNGSSINLSAAERILRGSQIMSLSDLLAARLSAAGPARRIAQVASVFGRDFTLQNLVPICRETIGDTQLTSGLEQLRRLGIIEVRVPDLSNPVFSFRHLLLQEAAYDSMLKADRVTQHDRIVRACLAGQLASMPDEIMAWHCEKSGRHYEAARFALNAAEACATRSALREAEQLLILAEAQLDACSAEEAVRDVLLKVLTLRGTIATAIYGTGSSEARSIYERGIAICREGEMGNPEKWFPLYWGWWFTSPDFDTRRGRSKIIVSDLENSQDPEIRLQSFHCAWAANFHSGAHYACLKCIEHGLKLYDPDRAIVSRGRYGGHDAKVCALGERAQSLWFTGEIDASTESSLAAVRWADEIAHVGSICHALDMAMLHGFYRRDRLMVSSLSERLRDIGNEHGLAGAIAKSSIFAGWCRADTAPDDGLHLIHEGLRVQKEVGTEEDLPIYLDMLAELTEISGSLGEALTILDKAIEHSLATVDAFWLAELYRRRAVLKWTACYQPGEISSDLNSSVRTANAQHARAILKKIQDSKALIALSSEGL